jgi:hypothetical protein
MGSKQPVEEDEIASLLCSGKHGLLFCANRALHRVVHVDSLQSVAGEDNAYVASAMHTSYECHRAVTRAILYVQGSCIAGQIPRIPLVASAADQVR